LSLPHSSPRARRTAGARGPIPAASVACLVVCTLAFIGLPGALVGPARAVVGSPGALGVPHARVPVAHAVEIRNFAYEPRELSVARGDTIVFTNHDIFTHTVTDDARTWDSGGIGHARSWRLVFQGSVSYHCGFHPSMKGSLALR
jgi:plastocyanin